MLQQAGADPIACTRRVEGKQQHVYLTFLEWSLRTRSKARGNEQMLLDTLRVGVGPRRSAPATAVDENATLVLTSYSHPEAAKHPKS